MRTSALRALLIAALSAGPDSLATRSRPASLVPGMLPQWPASVARSCKRYGALASAHVTADGRADSVAMVYGFPAEECLNPSLAAAADSVTLAFARSAAFVPALVRGAPASAWTLVPCVLPPDTSEAGYIFGRVLDRESGAPMRFANVVVIGTRLGAPTGIDGGFVVAVPPGSWTLKALMFGREQGFGTVSVPPRGADTLTFRLARMVPPEGTSTWGGTRH